jgi:hypothetical protein
MGLSLEVITAVCRVASKRLLSCLGSIVLLASSIRKSLDVTWVMRWLGRPGVGSRCPGASAMEPSGV